MVETVLPVVFQGCLSGAYCGSAWLAFEAGFLRAMSGWGRLRLWRFVVLRFVLSVRVCLL
jgi:hypothetical protein